MECRICGVWCKQDFPYIIDNFGKKVKRFKHGEGIEEEYIDEGCGDCGVKKGEYHHENCDIEMCPICEGQLLTCKCWKEYSK